MTPPTARRLPPRHPPARHLRAGLGVRVFGALSLAMLASSGGCAATDPEPECRTGADCASGACSRGMCLAQGGSGGEGVGGGGAAPAGGGGGAGGGGAGGGAGGAGGGSLCPHDSNGTITRAEVPLSAGLSAKFLTATDVTFATVGTTEGNLQVWDLTPAFAGDHTTLVVTEPLTGAWYEDSFPGATYAALLSDESDLSGVFEVTDTALLLRGVVSPADGVLRTELTYDPPVTVLSFPMSVGSTWATTSTVTGLAEGVAVFYTESYDQNVDERGELRAPFGDFDVLRVRTVLTRTVGALPTVIRSYAFASECFGTVATLRSTDNETSVEFVNVAEARRLTP